MKLYKVEVSNTVLLLFLISISASIYIVINTLDLLLAVKYLILTVAIIGLFVVAPKAFDPKVSTTQKGLHIVAGLIMGFVLLMFSRYTGFSIVLPTISKESLVYNFLSTTTVPSIIIPSFMLFLMTIPIIPFEEFIWRAFLQPITQKFMFAVTKEKTSSWTIAIILINIFFSITHNLAYSTQHYSLSAFVGAFVAGCIMSAGYLLTKDILTPIAIHLMINFGVDIGLTVIPAKAVVFLH